MLLENVLGTQCAISVSSSSGDGFLYCLAVVSSALSTSVFLLGLTLTLSLLSQYSQE